LTGAQNPSFHALWLGIGRSIDILPRFAWSILVNASLSVAGVESPYLVGIPPTATYTISQDPDHEKIHDFDVNENPLNVTNGKIMLSIFRL